MTTSEEWRSRRDQCREMMEGKTPSDRMKMIADVGATIRSMFGKPSSDINQFAQTLVRAGILDPSEFPDMEVFREEVHTIHMGTIWADSGFNVFSPSSDLLTGLLLTEPPPTSPEGLHLPFGTFAIRIPSQTIPMFISDEQIWVDTVWVHNFISFHRDNLDKPVEFFRYIATAGNTSLWRDRHPTQLDHADESMFNRVFEGDPPSVPEDDATIGSVLRLLKNFTHWLDSTGGIAALPRPKPPALKRKASKEARKRLEAGTWPHVWFLGQEVKLAPELKRIVPEVILGNHRKAASGWKVRMKHIVRGHWKLQAYGEGAVLRKRLWINPYWRGPEGAAAWSHLYENR